MHVPVSESILFHDGATLPTYTNDRGFGVAGTVSPTRSPARTLARQKYPDQRRRQEYLFNAYQIGGGLYVASYDERGRFGFSATLGFLAAGLDATVQIRGRNYLTAGYSAPDQGQVFLQHRAVNSPRLGIAVGLGGRYNTYGFNDSYFDIETEGVVSVGIRSYSILRAKGDTEGGIKLGTYTGYAPRLERPVFSLTLTLGQF